MKFTVNVKQRKQNRQSNTGKKNNNLTTVSGSHEANITNQYAIARRTVMDIISIRTVTRTERRSKAARCANSMYRDIKYKRESEELHLTNLRLRLQGCGN